MRPFALALGLIACSKQPLDSRADASASASDAAVDAGPLAQLVPVAQAPSSATLHVTSDRRIVVMTGSLPFDARADGTLVSLVPPDQLALPEELGAPAAAEPGVGLFSPTRAFKAVRGDADGALFFESSREGEPLLVWQEGRVSPTTVRATNVVRWRELYVGVDPEGGLVTVGGGAPPALPRELGAARALATSRDGHLVALTETRAVVWKTPERHHVEVMMEASCSLLPAFNGSVVIACGSERERKTIFRLGDRGFHPVFPELPGDARPGSVGSDGALYAAASRGREVFRCLDGTCRTMSAPDDLGAQKAAYYEQREDIYFDAGPRRQWASLDIGESSSRPLANRFQTVIGRNADDVWAILQGGTVVLHTGGPPKRIQLPSILDRDVMARNLRPPTILTSTPCQRLFVRLGADAESVASQASELTRKIGVERGAYTTEIRWWLVAGALHGEPVAGVVFAQANAGRPPTRMNAIARQIAADAPDARIYCTLPVLGRLL